MLGRRHLQHFWARLPECGRRLHGGAEHGKSGLSQYRHRGECEHQQVGGSCRHRAGPHMVADRRTLLPVLALSAMVGLVAPAAAGEIALDSAGHTFNAPVTTLKELRFPPPGKQEYDLSCGSAAIAT